MTLRWRSAPMCERCFIDEEEAVSHGQGGTRTIAKAPYQLSPEMRQVETCCSCDESTIVGIYIRRQVDEEETEEDVDLEGGVVMHPRAILEGPL